MLKSGGLARLWHRPLVRYVKLRFAHAPGILGTFSPSPTSKRTASLRSRHTSRHVRHARAVMAVGIAIPCWRGKRSRHSRRMRNPQFYVSGKRSMDDYTDDYRCNIDSGLTCSTGQHFNEKHLLNIIQITACQMMLSWSMKNYSEPFIS